MARLNDTKGIQGIGLKAPGFQLANEPRARADAVASADAVVKTTSRTGSEVGGECLAAAAAICRET